MIYREKGVTFMEVLIVIAIMVGIVVFAYPSFKEMLHGMESKRIKSTLVMATKEARVLSFTHRQNVVLCLADTNNQCHNRATDKVILFKDRDNNQRLDDGELLREYDLKAKYGKVEMNVSARRHYMKYFGDTGVPRGHFGHIKYCAVSGTSRFDHKVTITSIGYVWVGDSC